MVQRLVRIGVSGVVLEDQQRPRRCGHYDGKQIMDLDQYLVKLQRVLEFRDDLFVVARTDTQDAAESARRVKAFAAAGCDAVLVDAVCDLGAYCALRGDAAVPMVCNQLAGGKTPAWSLTEMSAAGIQLVIYSTPCLFAAQGAVEAAIRRLRADDGRLASAAADVKLEQCTPVLQDNLKRSYAT